MPPVQCICVSTGRTQPIYSDPVAAIVGCGAWACFAWALGPTGVGSCARAVEKEGGGPRSLGVPAAHGAAGSRPWQGPAGLWVAGSPGPQAAGCLLLPRPPSSSSPSPMGPVEWMEMGGFSVHPMYHHPRWAWHLAPALPWLGNLGGLLNSSEPVPAL